MLHWALSFHDTFFEGRITRVQIIISGHFLDDNLVYEKEFISILIFDFFIAQCIIYDTFSFLNFDDLFETFDG